MSEFFTGPVAIIVHNNVRVFGYTLENAVREALQMPWDATRADIIGRLRACTIDRQKRAAEWFLRQRGTHVDQQRVRFNSLYARDLLGILIELEAGE